MANPFFYKKQMNTTYIDPATSPTTWKDQSDNSLDGTITGATFSFGNAASVYNPFFSFDGGDDFVLISQSAIFDPGVGDFSIEVIFRADSFRADLDALLGQGRASTDNDKWIMIIVASKMGVYLKSAGTIHVNNLDFGGSTLNTGQWYHGIVTFDRSGNATGYIDGVAEPTSRDISAGEGDNMVMTKDMTIGVFKHPSVTRHFDGDIALVRWWNRALSAAEVLIQYNGGDFWQKTVPTADQWGSASEKGGTINDDTADDDTGNWTVGAGILSFDTDHYEITAPGVTEIYQAASGLTVGKKYRFSVQAKDGTATGVTVTLTVEPNGGGADIAIGTGVVTGASNNTVSVEWTATETNNEVHVKTAGLNGGNIEYQTFLNNQIGVVAEYRLAHENSFSPFEFPKGRQLPVNFPIVPRQIVGVAGGGQTVVDDLGDADERWPINVLRVSSTVKTNLLGFLQDSTVNYRENVFQFVEEDATDNEVRLWEPFPLDFPRVPGSLFNLQLVVRKEIF